MIDKLIPNIPVPILPESYDLSASYYELLVKCVNGLNKCIELVNSETAELEQVREQLEQIMPYLDDLAHMGERFAEIQQEIDDLISRLYDETTGDITKLYADFDSLSLDVQFLTNQIDILNNRTIETLGYALNGKMYEGNNAFRETWHANSRTVRGITFTYDANTGWFHAQGVLTAGDETAVELATYEIAEPYRTILALASSPYYLPYSQTGKVRMWYKDMMTDDTKTGYASGTTVRFQFGTQASQAFSMDNQTFNLQISAPTDSYSMKVILGQSNSDNTYTINLWICPYMQLMPAYESEWGSFNNYPIPSNTPSPLELRTQISQEVSARTQAIEAETAARQAADSTETQDRIAADNTLQDNIDANTRLIRGESEARVESIGEVYDEIDNLRTDLQDVANSAAKYGMGTAIPDTIDPETQTTVYPDLFTLPPGKYWRSVSPGNVQHLPTGFSGAFYCEIVNTISQNRRRIFLYPATATAAGDFYTCLETGSGYGHWFKFSGIDVDE